MNDKTFDNFKYGWINALEADKLKDGVVVDGLNWLITPDKIELRRGMKIIGTDAGAGNITGLKVGVQVDGTELLIRTRARKIEYYDTATEDWIENGTNVLPADADGEDVSLEAFTSLSGYSMYLSSPHSSIYRIMLANPDSIVDMSSTDFRGKMKIKNGRMFIWDRFGSTGAWDKTGLYGSKLTQDEYSDFNTITAEAIGALGSTTYTGTLAFKAGGAARSCFNVIFTGGVGGGTEDFNDNFDGTLTGSSGGTGTINYATGVYSVTFSAITDDVVTSTYYWEDPTDGTNGGICNFTYSATRAAGEGFMLRQDDGGGELQNIGEYNSDIYCLHEKKAWKTTISADDSDAANLPFRNNVGIPSWRAMTETGDGIYYVSKEENDKVLIKVLQIAQMSTAVVPISLSDGLDLSTYEFDKAVVKEWGNYIVIACREETSDINNRMLIYDRKHKLWSLPLDYYADVLEVYNGALEAGDSLEANVYELFSGFDDDDSLISNYITFNESMLGSSKLKKPHRFIIEGNIQPDQNLKISVSLDKGAFVEIGTIEGNGSYVDLGSRIYVGSNVIGKKEIGGGGSGETANHFQREFKVKIDKFETCQVKIEATSLGYVSVSRFGFKDTREKGSKMPNKYIS